MKTSIFLSLLLCIATVAMLSVNTFSQEAVNISVRQRKIANFPQEVAAKASTDANILIISGKILNAATLQPIGKTKINIDKLGDELVQASIDTNGNYAIALKKDELGEPIRIIFKVPGFKKFVAKRIDKSKSFADINILLEPEFSPAKRAGSHVVYKMNTDPFNPLVLKFE